MLPLELSSANAGSANTSPEPSTARFVIAPRLVELAIPPLGASGLSRSDFAQVIPAAERASSMQGNPVKLTQDELASILEAAL